MSEPQKPSTAVPALVTSLPDSDRRRSHRVKLAQSTRLRPSDPNFAEEVQTTLNVSRNGIYFVTELKHYYVGMHVRVTLPYRPADPFNQDYTGAVVRVEPLDDGRLGVAVHLLLK